jgi:hypothetical protein
MTRTRFTPQRTWAIALVAGLSACGGGGDGADSGESSDGRARDVADVPSADNPAEFVSTYESLLTNLLETARSIENARDARRHADDYARDVERMRAMSDEFQGANAFALAGAFAARGQQIGTLGQELSVEMLRIQSDPALAEAFSDALGAYERDR